jgi:hypothetical protein
MNIGFSAWLGCLIVLRGGTMLQEGDKPLTELEMRASLSAMRFERFHMGDAYRLYCDRNAIACDLQGWSQSADATNRPYAPLFCMF